MGCFFLIVCGRFQGNIGFGRYNLVVRFAFADVHTSFEPKVSGNSGSDNDHDKSKMEQKDGPFLPVDQFVFEYASCQINHSNKKKQFEPPGLIYKCLRSCSSVIVLNKSCISY